MVVSEKTAIIDTDFLIKIAEIRWDIGRKCEVLCELFSALNIDAATHPLVYEKEVITQVKAIEVFVDRGILNHPSFDDFFGNDIDKREYYAYVVSELYCRLKGTNDLLRDKDIFSFWQAECSLGEVHSIALCITCECGMFLSDDYDSKIIVERAKDYCSASFKVYNRRDVLDAIGDKKYEILDKHDRKAFLHTNRS